MDAIDSKIYEELYNAILIPIYRKKRIEDKILIVSSFDFKIEYLNEISKDFLLLVDGKRKFFEIIDAIKRKYLVQDNILIPDLVNLLRTLQWKRIITTATSL